MKKIEREEIEVGVKEKMYDTDKWNMKEAKHKRNE